MSSLDAEHVDISALCPAQCCAPTLPLLILGCNYSDESSAVGSVQEKRIWGAGLVWGSRKAASFNDVV